MSNLKQYFLKYKEAILYLVFGGLTTVINIVSYHLLYEIMSVSNTLSNVIAWVLSVLFAFITNKIWVFESKERGAALLREAVSFFGCRAATGVLDLAIMFLCVDLLSLPATPCKIASNVIVIILNFIFSKLLIFKGDKK